MTMADDSFELVRVSNGVRLWAQKRPTQTHYYVDHWNASLWKDTFDELADASSVFEKLVESVEQSREALASSDIDADLHLSLRVDLKRRQGDRVIWGVLREDTYETVFGDGYFAYLEAAFDTKREAQSFAFRHAEKSTDWHIREYRLRLVDGELTLIALREPVEIASLKAKIIPTDQQEPTSLQLIFSSWGSDQPDVDGI